MMVVHLTMVSIDTLEGDEMGKSGASTLRVRWQSTLMAGR